MNNVYPVVDPIRLRAVMNEQVQAGRILHSSCSKRTFATRLMRRTNDENYSRWSQNNRRLLASSFSGLHFLHAYEAAMTGGRLAEKIKSEADIMEQLMYRLDHFVAIARRQDGLVAAQQSSRYVGSSSVQAPAYDLAISFAGEDRYIAEYIADGIQRVGYRVFYDIYEQSALWGKDLYQHLHDVYANRARFCLIIISEHYVRKLWTRHELRAAQTRAFRESSEYILPLAVDDTQLPGLPQTTGLLSKNGGLTTW